MTPIVDEKLDLPALNAMFEKSEPSQIVEWSAAQFGKSLVMSSSFGEQAAVMIHLVTRAIPDIKIVFVNTGYLFPETHQFMEELRQRFDLNVWIYRTRNDPIAWLKDHGETDPRDRKDVPACCSANKNEPFERAMRELAPKAWFRGVRRAQTEERKGMNPIEWSKRYNCYAISPILNWSSRDIGLYMKKHDLPWHPLVEKGYLSIGCNPLSCTQAVAPGEDPRAGRWANSNKVECGINLNNSLDSANL